MAVFVNTLSIFSNVHNCAVDPKGKGKGRDTWYSATYMSRLVTRSALQSPKWQLIGMSQWCRSALCGHPLPALTDNWTHGAASRHTTAPISHTDHCSLYHYIIFWNLLPVMKHPIVVVSAIEWKWFANSIRLRLRQAQHLKTCCSRRADNGHGVEAISRNPGRNIDKPQPHSPPPCRQTSRRRRPTVGRVDTYRPNG